MGMMFGDSHVRGRNLVVTVTQVGLLWSRRCSSHAYEDNADTQSLRRGRAHTGGISLWAKRKNTKARTTDDDAEASGGVLTDYPVLSARRTVRPPQ